MTGGYRRVAALVLIVTGALLRAASDSAVQMGDKLS